MDTAVKRLRSEAVFHDRIRAGYTPNQRFYSIAQESDEFVMDWLKKKCSDKTVLDYCCGEGDLSLELAKVAGETYGIDASQKSLWRARLKRGPNVLEPTFAVMDAHATAFCDNEFDVINISGVLHHLDIQRAYKELARILKPDGQIICNEPLAYNPLIQAYRKLTPHFRTPWEAKHILRKKDIEVAREVFRKVKILRFFHLATLLAIPFPRLLRVLERLDALILKIPGLRWLAWQMVFVLSEPIKET